MVEKTETEFEKGRKEAYRERVVRDIAERSEDPESRGLRGRSSNGRPMGWGRLSATTNGASAALSCQLSERPSAPFGLR